jgi:hypothetical protein
LIFQTGLGKLSPVEKVNLKTIGGYNMVSIYYGLSVAVTFLTSLFYSLIEMGLLIG